MAWAIETRSLTKIFPVASNPGLFSSPKGVRVAVDRLSLNIRQGEVFGLLGPNGAGKTTLLKILATLIIPTSGTATVNGHDLAAGEAVRESLTLVNSDERSFYWRLTGYQNLEFFGTLYRLDSDRLKARIGEILDLVGLTQAGHQPVGSYSSGMRQRLALARALLPEKPILLLDEPTKGLDPAAVRQIHRLLREELAARRNITVVLATHQLGEAEALCDRVAVLYQGRLKACGPPPELRRSLNLVPRWRLVLTALPPGLTETLGKFPVPLHLSPLETGQVVLEWETPDETVNEELVRLVLKNGGKIHSLTQEPVSLEAVFEHFTRQAGAPYPCLSLPDPGAEDSGRQCPETYLALTKNLRPSWKPALNTLRLWPRVSAAFLKRDFLEEWSYRLSFAFQFVIIFFSVSMFYFLGRLFGPSVSPYLAPYATDYFPFVLVGLAFSRYFDVSLSTFYQSLRTAQTTGTLEAMFNTPTSISLMVLSSSLWSYLFTSFQVLVYLGVGVVLFQAPLKILQLPALLLVLGLTLLSFSSLGILAAAFIMVYKKGDPVVWLFTSIAGLLGGIYYPVAVLPSWLKPLAYGLPITYALEAVRLVALKGASLTAVSPHLLVLALFGLTLLPLSLMVFHLAVNRAKVDGSLSQY